MPVRDFYDEKSRIPFSSGQENAALQKLDSFAQDSVTQGILTGIQRFG
jgi:hypothetical protein